MNPLVQFDAPRKFENADGSTVNSSTLAKLSADIVATREPANPQPGEPSFLRLSISATGPLQTSINELEEAAFRSIKELSITISYTEFAGLADGVVEFSKDTSALIPEGARLTGASIESVTAFNDFGEGLVVMKFGPTGDADQFYSEVTVSNAAGFPKSPLEADIYPTMELTSGAYRLTITDNSAIDLNDFIAGSVTVKLFYF